MEIKNAARQVAKAGYLQETNRGVCVVVPLADFERLCKAVGEKTYGPVYPAYGSSASAKYPTFKIGDKVRRKEDGNTLEVIDSHIENYPPRNYTLVRYIEGPNQGITEEIPTKELVLVNRG